MKARLTLLLTALVLTGLAAPGSATARPCRGADAHPIHSLYTLNGVRCGTGDVVAGRLARRFDSAAHFARGFSQELINQRDGRGRRWKCQWNSASVQPTWSAGTAPATRG